MNKIVKQQFFDSDAFAVKISNDFEQKSPIIITKYCLHHIKKHVKQHQKNTSKTQMVANTYTSRVCLNNKTHICLLHLESVYAISKNLRRTQLVENSHNTSQHLMCAFSIEFIQICYGLKTCMQHQKR